MATKKKTPEILENKEIEEVKIKEIEDLNYLTGIQQEKKENLNKKSKTDISIIKDEKKLDLNIQLLIIKDGVLREVEETEEMKKELQKDNWHYRLTSASRRYALIDYDKDLARPYVKSFMAKMNKLKEVKMLRAVIVLILFSFVTFIFLFFIQYFRLGNTIEVINKSISKLEVTQQRTNNIETSAMERFNNLNSKQGQEIQNITNTSTGISNHLYR